MIAKDLIDYNIPLLNKEDKVSKALELMEEFECSRLPVVASEGYYAGFLEEKIISSGPQIKKASAFKNDISDLINSIAFDSLIRPLYNSFSLSSLVKMNFAEIFSLVRELISSWNITSLLVLFE